MTDRYAVIGHPVAHSRSPQIHAYFANQTEQDISYERLLAPLDGFSEVVHEFVRCGGRGMNVTVPFKREAFFLADQVTERARVAGAVNTLTVTDGMLHGDNTDGVGLVVDITHNLHQSLKGGNILMLGAGGAAHGVMGPLLELCPSMIVVANRTLDKAHELAQNFSSRGDVRACSFSDLDRVFDWVVNATSASVHGEILPIPEIIFSEHTLAYDMMYGAEDTLFMCAARQQGAVVCDGMGMLIEQAAESFFVWRGIRPDTASILKEWRTRAMLGV